MSAKKDSKEKPSEIRYIKLPYIGKFSGIAKNKIMKLVKQFCKSDCEIRIVFTLFSLCLRFSFLLGNIYLDDYMQAMIFTLLILGLHFPPGRFIDRHIKVVLHQLLTFSKF